MSKQNFIEYYLEYAKLDVFKRRIERAKKIISDFLDKMKNKNIYVSWSGGKDSTCMLFLVREFKENIKVMTEKDNFDFPGEFDYVKRIIKKYNLNCDILNIKIEDIEKYNIFEDIHSRKSELSKFYFYDVIKDYQEKNKMEGVFIGLRAEESKGRLYNYKTRGAIYFNKKDNIFICTPVINLKAEDIFAYLLTNDIEILDIYWKTRFVKSPNEIRKSWYLPSFRACKGSLSWLRYYYPDLFEILIQKFPEGMNYV